jgi:hypothetical protein
MPGLTAADRGHYFILFYRMYIYNCGVSAHCTAGAAVTMLLYASILHRSLVVFCPLHAMESG